MEKIFDYCIICGRKNNSHYHNLCNDCNNKIEQVEDIINLKNHFEGKFTKRHIVDLGYSKPYADALVRELLNEKLILKTDKSYCFNEDYFKDYLDEIEMYGEIELALSEFASGKLTLRDIKDSQYYTKGRDGIKPFIQVYKIVSDAVFKEFTGQLALGIEIDEIMQDTTITQDEITAWYYDQLKQLERGIKNKDFINYNKISIDSYIKLRASGKTQKEIVDELHLPADIVDFWLKTHVKELDYFKFSLDDTLIDLILKAISENKTKTEFLDELDISNDELIRLMDNYDEFNNIYTREYINKRRNLFIYSLKDNNLKVSIEKSYLNKQELDEWLKIGEKDFELNHKTELAEFYEKTIALLMNHYVKYRKSALTKKESALKIDQSPKTVDSWLRRDDHDIFINFQNECQDITLDVIVSGIKKGLTLKQASSLGDMSQNNLMKLIQLGENGEEKYVKLYQVYQNKHVPKQLDVFLDKIQSSKYKKALKSAHLTEDELNKFYIMGLQGISTFKSFTDRYFEFKLKNYTKEIIQKGKKPQRAARNANFIEHDFKYRQKEIDNCLVKKQLEIILPMVREGFHAKIIASKINLDVEDFFDWYVKGYQGDERFKQFSECYWENRMKNSIDEFQALFDKGVSEKFFLKYVVRPNVKAEYFFWKKLGLFRYSNEILSEKDQMKIYKERAMSIKENVERILELAEDEDSDMSIDEMLDDIEDLDIKQQVKNLIKKEDREDG